MTDNVTVTYHAQEQVKRLSDRERDELAHLLTDADSLHNAAHMDDSGRFVSRLGRDKRVYWTRSDDGSIVVLSVVVYNALAA